MAARRQGGRAAAARTAGSRSTACTCGWATTRTPSASCASATPSSIARTPIRRRPSRPGATRSSPPATVGLEDRRDGRLAPLARPVHAERPCSPAGARRRDEARAHARRRPAPGAPADRGLPRLAARRRDRVGRGLPHRLRPGAGRTRARSSTASHHGAGRHARGGDPGAGARSTAPAWRPRCGRSTGRSPRRRRRCAGLVEGDADLRRTWRRSSRLIDRGGARDRWPTASSRAAAASAR